MATPSTDAAAAAAAVAAADAAAAAAEEALDAEIMQVCVVYVLDVGVGGRRGGRWEGALCRPYVSAFTGAVRGKGARCFIRRLLSHAAVTKTRPLTLILTLPSSLPSPPSLPSLLQMSSEEIRQRIRLLDNEIRIMKSDITSIDSDSESQRKRIKENLDKIKLNKQLPYLVGNVVEILDMEEEEEEEEDGAAADIDSQRKGVSAVIKTSTRQTIFLPIPGLVDVKELKPGDLVGTNKDSYLILEKLPAEYDSRVKAMEVDTKPTEEWGDIGGCDKQIQELIEAVVLPMTRKDLFIKIGVKPPKGVLLYG